MSIEVDEHEIDEEYEDELPPLPEGVEEDPWHSLVPMFGKPVLMPRQPRCIVCQQTPEIRGVIEMLIYTNHSYREIYSSLPDDCSVVLTKDGSRRTNIKNFSARVSRHFGKGKKGAVSHSDFTVTMAFQMRDVVDNARGRDSTFDARLGAEYHAMALVNWILGSMYDGTMKAPSPKDLVTALEFLDRLLNPTGNTDSRMFRDAMEVVIPAMARHLPPATFQSFASSLEHNPLWADAYRVTMGLPSGS